MSRTPATRRLLVASLLLQLGLVSGGQGATQQVPRPPPQESLEIPPIIDPAKTAVLSGFVPITDPDAKSPPAPPKAGQGENGAQGGAPGGSEDPEAEEGGVKEVRRTVVWVIPPSRGRVPRGPDQAMIASERGINPTTLAVTPGTVIDFRTHERGVVIVRGEGLMRVDRRLTRDTRTVPVVPRRTGAIDLTVAGNDEAAGLIVCVDSPYLTVADAQGAFRIVGIAPGRRQVRIRLPDGKVLERTVTLIAGRELTVDWRQPG